MECTQVAGGNIELRKGRKLYMKLSTTTGFYRHRPGGIEVPMTDCIRKLHAIGYEDIDLNFCLTKKDTQEKGKCKELEPDNWHDWVLEMKELLAGLNMTASQAHAPFYNVLDKDYPDREHTEKIVRRSIMAAGELGVKAIVIHAGFHLYDNNFRKCLEDNMEYYKPHLELAARYGLSVAVENMFDRTDPSRKCRRDRFAARTEEIIEIVDRLSEQYDNVGICWDFGHANMMGWNQPQALEMMGERLIATHVQDNYADSDHHLLPCHGTIEWEPIMKTLKKIDYKGVFAYETHKAAERVPEPVIDALLTYSLQLGKYLISLYDAAK